jgi:hypothetical protein
MNHLGVKWQLHKNGCNWQLVTSLNCNGLQRHFVSRFPVCTAPTALSWSAKTKTVASVASRSLLSSTTRVKCCQCCHFFSAAYCTAGRCPRTMISVRDNHGCIMGWPSSPESQRDSITQPRVDPQRGTTLGHHPTNFANPERVESNRSMPHYSVVPQSLAKILVHLVFSTKDRQPFLRDKPLREELHRYLGGILTNLDCQPVILCGIDSTLSGLMEIVGRRPPG